MTDTDELIGDLRERLVRIETKLDAHAEAKAEDRQRLTQTEDRLDGQGDRITKLETNQRIMAALGAILLAILTFFQDTINGFLA